MTRHANSTSVCVFHSQRNPHHHDGFVPHDSNPSPSWLHEMHARCSRQRGETTSRRGSTALSWVSAATVWRGRRPSATPRPPRKE
ncbi:hypothetical protein CEXT_426441 [Caerostris extrusa]|uniref:Uncharacterized protein n=1 Tax=Caerostris extrusa TaxID=172846 RepID=A0AAV4Y5D5_CAEEX|nr:hypothetical protein CEXT_426441 [Caerostris extrusa]